MLEVPLSHIISIVILHAMLLCKPDNATEKLHRYKWQMRGMMNLIANIKLKLKNNHQHFFASVA
jgi:hypothetical protein